MNRELTFPVMLTDMSSVLKDKKEGTRVVDIGMGEIGCIGKTVEINIVGCGNYSMSWQNRGSLEFQDI